MKLTPAVVTVAVLLLAGCGSSGTPAVTAPSSTPTSAATPTTPAPAADAFTLNGQVTLTGTTDVYGVDSSTPDPKVCYGTFGYADLKVGTQVLVAVNSDTVAVGSLTESREDSTNHLCALRIVVDDVPAGLKFYVVKIGGHSSPVLTEDEARQTVKLNLP